nr:DUF5050 domain-containing protein [uncultured Butyrivibrio sp.]
MNKRIIIGFLIVFVIIAGIMTFYVIDSRIPMDPADYGNSAGNLHNGGLFFEMDGKVYFSNPYDYDCLYSMNVDETHPKRLTSMRTKYISGANGFLYFYMDSTKTAGKVSGLGTATNQYGIYRCKVNGRDQVCLVRDFCGELQLCGEYIYYQTKLDGGALNKMRVDKTNKSVVAPEMISPVCYSNGYIYYTGVANDHHLHAINTKAGDSVSDVVGGNCFFPVVHNNYIYYMNGDYNYSLWRYDMYNGTNEQIVAERLDNFTMDDNYIYYTYSNNLNSALKRCDLDGDDQILLYPAVTNSLCLTSKYLYFKVYGVDDVVYHMPLDGSNQISVLTFD